MHFLNVYISHGSGTRFWKGDEKYYIYFVDNLSLFLTVNEYSKSVNNLWSYCKTIFDTSFFETQCTWYIRRYIIHTYITVINIHSFVRSFVRSFIHSFIHVFIQWMNESASLFVDTREREHETCAIGSKHLRKSSYTKMLQ